MSTAFEISAAGNKTIYPPWHAYAKPPQSRSRTPLFLQRPPQLEAMGSRAFPSRESPQQIPLGFHGYPPNTK